MKTVAPRHLGTTLAVMLSVLVGTTALHAGTKEINAINNELLTIAPGKTLATATDTELSNAVRAAFGDTANRKLNPAVIAAEALKGAQTATNIGTQLATDILADLATPLADTGLYAKIKTNVDSFVGVASKSAATSTGANPTQIPTWAAVFIAAEPVEVNRNGRAISIAAFAGGSPTAMGAIIGGRTLNPDGSIDEDAERIALVNQALVNKKLRGAVQQMTQYVADDADDPVLFTFGFFPGGANTKYLAKIVTGSVTANPTAASDILNQMFVPGVGGDTLTSPIYIATVKNAATLAKNLALVSDAEEVSQLAAEFGKRIGTVSPVTNKVVGIKQSSVNTIAKSLVVGLTTRATATSIVDDVSRDNRLDEISEVGGYLLNAIKGLPVFQVNNKANLKNAPSLIVGLMKTIVANSLKVHRSVATGEPNLPSNLKVTIVKAPNFQASAAEDLSGAIALTLRFLESAIDPGIYAAIKTALLSDSIGTKIAGKSKTLFTIDGVQKTISAFVHDTLQAIMSDPLTDLAMLDTKYAKYENGTNELYAQGPFNDPTLGTVVEPETDIRNR